MGRVSRQLVCMEFRMSAPRSFYFCYPQKTFAQNKTFSCEPIQVNTGECSAWVSRFGPPCLRPQKNGGNFSRHFQRFVAAQAVVM